MFSNSKAFLPLAAILFFFSATAWTQKPWKLQWGKPHEPENPGSIRSIVHTDQQGYYALRTRIPEREYSSKDHKAALELYNKNLDFVKAEALELEYKGEPLEFEGFISLQGKHFLLSSYYNAKEDKDYLFARSVNLKTMKAEGDYTNLMGIYARQKILSAHFILAISPDSSLLLAYGKSQKYEDKKERFSLAVMDRNMKVLWTKEVEIPDPENEINVTGYGVDNQGNAFILTTRDHFVKVKINHNDYKRSHTIFAYRDNGNVVKEHEVSPEGKHIMELELKPLQQGDILCAGYYSEKEEVRLSEGRVKGVFSCKINTQNGEDYDKSIQPLNIDILTSDLSSRKQEKEKNKQGESEQELTGYMLRQLLVQENGNMLLVGEKYGSETASDGRWNGNEWQVEHHGDLLVISLSPKGQINWAAKVDKKQKGSVVDEYIFVSTAGKQHFIYKNGFKRSEEYMLASISTDGKVSYPDFEKEGNEIANGVALPPAMKSMIVWSGSNSKYRVGKISFQ